MSRKSILILGAICWTGAAADAVWRLMNGDTFVPAAMAIAFVVWTTVRVQHYRKVTVHA